MTMSPMAVRTRATSAALVGKLAAARAIGLLLGLFIDVAPKVVAGWRARAAVEPPSHLRTRPVPLRVCW
jgi:hypothetical protein